MSMIRNYLFYKYLVIGFGLSYLFDITAIKLSQFSKIEITSSNYRWFFIHFLFNSIITIIGSYDLMLCIEISKCATVEWINGDIIYGLLTSFHLYHSLYFNLTKTDIIHHVSTAFLSTPLIITYHRYPTAIVGVWFMSGLPGAIDYFLLWLVKMGYFDSMLEKKIYVWLSVWLRAPGCVLTSTLQLGLYNIIDKLSWVEIIAIIWDTSIVYLNGIYFMHDTVSKYYLKNKIDENKIYN
jgi:hypothetical protein